MERTSRTPKIRWAITIGLVLGTICVAAFTFFYKLPTVYKFEADSKAPVVKMNSCFSKTAILNSEDKAPYLKTGFDNIFYSISTDGNVEFYKYQTGEFKKTKASDTLTITLPLGEKHNKVVVKLLKGTTKVEGYGVYSDKESDTYPYAFLKFTENRITDNPGYIVFVDYSIEDFYNNNKTYETAYVYDSDTKEFTPIFPEDAKEGDTIIPVEFICSRGDGFYFFKKSETDSTAYSFYKKNSAKGSSSFICDDLAIPYAVSSDSDLLVFIKAGNKTSTDGFNLVELSLNKKPVHTFSGSTEQYFVKDGYVFNKSTKTLYSIKENTSKTISSAFTISGIDDFTASKDGNKIALTGTFAGNKEKMMVYDFETDCLGVYAGDALFLSKNSNLAFVDDNLYFVSPATTSDKVVNFVASWDDII